MTTNNCRTGSNNDGSIIREESDDTVQMNERAPLVASKGLFSTKIGGGGGENDRSQQKEDGFLRGLYNRLSSNTSTSRQEEQRHHHNHQMSRRFGRRFQFFDFESTFHPSKENQVRLIELSQRDKSSDMTHSRRIAKYLSKFSWYNPSRVVGNNSDNSTGSDLDGDNCSSSSNNNNKDNGVANNDRSHLHVGWWYFEHYTLPRYLGNQQPEQCRPSPSADDNSRSNSITNSTNIDGPTTTDQRLMVSATRGDHRAETYLYPVWTTAETDLAGFGDDIGIYFFTLRMLSIIFVVAGLMSMPNILFFASAEWDPHQKYTERWRLLEASAVCTDQIWKVRRVKEISRWAVVRKFFCFRRVLLLEPHPD
jgi:hypothetical protein